MKHELIVEWAHNLVNSIPRQRPINGETPIELYDMRAKTNGLLREIGIYTMEEASRIMLEEGESYFLRIKGFGETSLYDLKKAITDFIKENKP